MEKRKQHRAIIGLLNVPELGLQRIKQLILKSGIKCAEDIFNLSLPELLKIDGIGEQVAKNIHSFNDWDKVDKILKNTDKCGASLISIDDEYYPELLKHIYDPPIILWYKGDKSVFKLPGLAVIGTRRAGAYGLGETENWVKNLVANGLCINSGLAYGVDAKAHQAALEQGGKTIAVLGSGIDVLYPAKNSRLASKIIESGGIIVSEYIPGTPPDAVNFPGRNRIVSGMSLGTLVVESGIKGGSMITARYALDQNREVFVIPHQLGNLQGEGCNYLIRTGQGKLVQSIKDITEELSIETVEGTDKPAAKNEKWKTLSLSSDEEKICSLLSEQGSIQIDKISEILNKPTHELLSVILNLELNGVIKQKVGKYFELA